MCLGDSRLPPRDRDSTLRALRYALNDEFEGARNLRQNRCNSLGRPTPTALSVNRRGRVPPRPVPLHEKPPRAGRDALTDPRARHTSGWIVQ